jgi:CRISPR-associated protein Csx14
MLRQTVLISSLGESPAVVTEAVDKLEQEENIQFNQVVTLGTSKYEVRQSAEVLSEHIPAHYGGRITYIPNYIEATDISNENENLDYLTRMANLLRTYRPYSDVYVSLAGGRKTMSAIVALAVQIYGAKLLCHVIHLTLELNEVLQRKMQATYLKRYPKEREELLHPVSDELILVRFPLVSLYPILGDLMDVLSDKKANIQNPVIERLLLSSGLIQKEGNLWITTAQGQQLLSILREIESLPEQSPTDPKKKKVDLKDHHGKDRLLSLVEKIRYFPYAESIVSTDNNPRFDRGRAIETPHRKLLIEIPSGQPDVLRVTLAYTDAGYAMEIRTRAQTMSQAERIKRKLEEFLT